MRLTNLFGSKRLTGDRLTRIRFFLRGRGNGEDSRDVWREGPLRLGETGGIAERDTSDCPT